MTGEALDYYALLGVPVDAGLEQIKARYRAILSEARSKIGSRQIDAEAIALMREAYGVLSDPERRAGYDQDRAVGPEAPQKHELRLLDDEAYA